MRGNDMWTLKQFKTSDSMNEWIKANEHRYQITIVFINNGYAIEYKKIRFI